MRIAYLGAGAAGRICGACFHDNGLATALRARGEDILLIPTYTPIRTDEENISHSRVFFGGINVYLQQKSAFFRHTPWFLDRLLDAPRLLQWLATRSNNMQAAELGELTVSTLRGTDGRQRKEIAKLVRWLKEDFRPDIVHLSNVMLAGTAAAIRDALHVPVVAGLMGEDIFLEQLPEPHYSECRALLRQRAAELDHCTALNRYYADLMSDYLDLPRDKITVIRHGLNLTGYGDRAPRDPGAPPVVGFFARIAVEKGLHNLIEAAALLRDDPTVPAFRLQAAGYLNAADQPYLERIVARVDELGLRERFEYLGELDRPAKLRFLHRVDMLAVPTTYHESKGISVLEAAAAGVPLVLPAHGTFPEYIAATGGGVLCAPEDPRNLARAIAVLLRDPAQRETLGIAGAAAIRRDFTAEKMAAEHQALYQRLLAARG